MILWFISLETKHKIWRICFARELSLFPHITDLKPSTSKCASQSSWWQIAYRKNHPDKINDHKQRSPRDLTWNLSACLFWSVAVEQEEEFKQTKHTQKNRLPLIKRDIRLWICKVTSWDGNRKRQWVRQHFQRCPQLINKHKLHCNPFFGWAWIVCKVVMWWWERIQKWNGFWHMHRPGNTGILCDSRIIFSSL